MASLSSRDAKLIFLAEHAYLKYGFVSKKEMENGLG